MAAKWWTLVAVCAGVFMLLLDITIVNVALPDIQRQFDGSLSDLQWVIDAYALSLAALLLTAGSLADLYGRRRVFAIGLVLFTIGSALCGFAPSLLFLCLARAGQGIGGAAMFATALALLASAFHGKDRGTAFGAFGATTGVAVAIGPVLGGVLTSGLSWRWIFFVNIPICLVALTVALTRVEESRDPDAGRPDWLGFVTFSLALGRSGLRPDRGRAQGLGRQRRADQPRGRGGAAGGLLRHAGVAAPADVRPEPAPQADLHRGSDRRLRRLGVDLLAARLPGDLRPERARVLGRRHRFPISVPVRDLVRGRRGGRTPDHPRADQAADRSGVRGPRRRSAAAAADQPRLVVDRADPGAAGQRRRRSA